MLVDVENCDFHLSAELVEQAMTSKARVVMPVHLYGQMAPMPAIMDLAYKYELLVLEDCAQAHGAMIEGVKAGSWGHTGAFSFYPGKNLGALGDGGCVITKDRSLAELVRQLGNYGSKVKYRH